jgi:phosphoribosylaminoimidazole-succinocarboxamide synthase
MSVVDLPEVLDAIAFDLPDRRDGKVRISYELTDTKPPERIFITTDRLSAFDRIITLVPHKGQVLNQLAAWWFDTTRDLCPNHLLDVPDPNVSRTRAARPLPVEVVVRGHITGVTTTSLWHQYQLGLRDVDGVSLPDGLREHAALPRPVITPTTKAEAGAHDTNIRRDEVVALGLVDADLWDHVCEVALALFGRGRDVAAGAGLILADTKYEFGLDAATGELLVIDEMHTPDSSRYWLAESYDERLAAGLAPESLDKEFVRRALRDLDYRGDGPPPTLGADVIAATSARYVAAFETITGNRFIPGDRPIVDRIHRNLGLPGPEEPHVPR